jgi:transposase
MTLPQDVIGVDVSKEWIDCHRLSTGAAWRVEATRRALRRFAGEAVGALVVFEASGGYERALGEALDSTGVAWARVNPRQVREFARASGRLAKTDRVDAAVLAAFGRARAPAPAPARPRNAAVERLVELVGRREVLVGMRTAEMQRLGRARRLLAPADRGRAARARPADRAPRGRDRGAPRGLPGA